MDDTAAGVHNRCLWVSSGCNSCGLFADPVRADDVPHAQVHLYRCSPSKDKKCFLLILSYWLTIGNLTHRFLVKTRGAPQHIDFSSNPDIFAYVPQIKRVSQPFPYLVCDIDDIDQGLVGWNDPAHSYDFYNLIFDVPHKSLRRTKIIEENTRDTTTIAQQDAYNDEEFIQNPLSRNAASPGNQAGRPIYSIIRHYPTPWQIKFAAQGQSYGAL